MHNMAAILRRYQTYNQVTGRFDQVRSQRAYARLLGIDPGQLTRYYQHKQDVSLRTIQALARLYPCAAIDIAQALMHGDEAA